jgi:hypothetical protein
MTKTFDDKARKRWYENLFQYEETYNGGKVKDMKVHKISAMFARPYIAKYHYTKTYPDSTLYSYAGYIKDRLAGIITYGMGSGKNQYTALIPNIKNGEYLELTRLWSPDGFPKNTETKLIAESMKLLPKEIRLIVSFADPSRNHVGTIYQASNFYYCGTSNSGKMLITEDGIEKHPRLLGIYKMRHPEYKKYTNKELMKLLKYKYINNSYKHRYVLLTGNKSQRKKDYEYIKDKIIDYPKRTTL